MLKPFTKPNILSQTPNLFAQITNRTLTTKLHASPLNSPTNPTTFDLCSILSSCCRSPNALSHGVQIHAHIVVAGHTGNLFLASKLVDLYSKSGHVFDAKKVFDEINHRDLVLWTSMVSGFAQNGFGSEAVSVFRRMFREGIKPNCFTLVSAVTACGSLRVDWNHGRLFHGHIVKVGVESNAHVLSALIDFYAKCGDVFEAQLLFESSLDKDAVVYNSMICSYAINACGEEAIKVFVEMFERGMELSSSTLASVLSACGGLAALVFGKQMHLLAIKLGFYRNVFVVGSLLDMYAKSGSIEEAHSVFNTDANVRESVLWTSMIVGYAQNGRGLNALKLFEKFVGEGGKPDNVCFMGILTACSHAGLLGKGLRYFEEMKVKYGLVPDLDHYACVVDLYGRTGHLREAKDLIMRMPSKPNAVILSTFLEHCKFYGETELAKEASAQLLDLEPYSAAPYVMLSNNCAELGLWREAAELRKLMRTRGLRKSAGCSWIELEGGFHMFSANDVSHSKSLEIYHELYKMTLEMRDIGSVPIIDADSAV